MQTRLPTVLLGSSSVATSYIVILVADRLPNVFRVAYHIDEKARLETVMPRITQIAAGNSWIFVLAALLPAILVNRKMRQPNASAIRLTALGLCFQGFVFWIAMFCFCFFGFSGPTSLHKGPVFDLGCFLAFEAGVFPVCLLALLAPIAASSFEWGLPKARNSDQGPAADGRE